jgi:Ca2+-binding RTX toxin-like protein
VVGTPPAAPASHRPNGGAASTEPSANPSKSVITSEIFIMTTSVNGNAGNDILLGNSNPADIHDILNANWSAGTDTMVGGTGNDTYQVNDSTDVALENAGEGYDTLLSRATTYNMGNNIEAIVLDNTPTQLVFSNGVFQFVPSAISATGNTLGNYMAGNDRNNTLSGGDGNDSLYGNNGSDTLNGDAGDDYLHGGADNDTLNGGQGNDTLYGGTGADAMTGGTGNDTYWLDDLGDSVSEGLFAGVDQVYSSVNHSLGFQVENLTLTGTAVQGYGNDLNNTIVGNSGNNTLCGFGGADAINGGAGNDRIDGMTGIDTLTGGNGADTFIIRDVGAANRDVITDFSHADDSIELSNVLDAAMVGALSPGLKGLSFSGGAVAGNGLNAGWYFENQVFNLSGIYYYDGNGEVWYNPTNGVAGDELLLCKLGNGLSAQLDNSDFVYGN